MADTPAVQPPPLTLKHLAWSLVPISPIPFTGDQALLAYLRVGIYGLAAYGAFGKSKKASLVFGGAAALCVATSLMSGVWSDMNQNKQESPQ